MGWIETDLHEWLTNKNYSYDLDNEAEKSYKEFEDNQGNYPDGSEGVWEDAKAIRIKESLLGSNLLFDKYLSNN